MYIRYFNLGDLCSCDSIQYAFTDAMKGPTDDISGERGCRILTLLRTSIISVVTVRLNIDRNSRSVLVPTCGSLALFDP